MDIDDSGYFWHSGPITLRRPRPDDWEALIHHMYDSQGRFFFNDEIDLPIDPETYRQRDEFLAPDKLPYLCFAIENDAGRHVGIANVFGIDERNGVFGPVGIVIDPAERGHGYATAAYRLLGRYFFLERRMHKWNNGYLEENAASAALHRKLGFRPEGLQRDMHFHEGRYWNVVLCGMTEREFMENERKLDAR